MSVQSFKRSQVIQLPLKEAWAFFVNPHNLPRITPPSLCLKIVSETKSEVYPGQLICYTVKPFLNMALYWTTEISHLCAPNFFVDEQRIGPYRFWYHQHFLTPEGESSTRVEDVVSYQVPFGSLGDLIAGRLVERKLKEIFDYREAQLSLLSAGGF
jgi:ligand-binding SRPBCC domain-containing protein